MRHFKRPMKKILIPLFASLLALASCNDDAVTEELAQSKTEAENSEKASATASVTGLTRFKASDLAIPSGGLSDGTKFYKNKLRANVAYYPYSVMKENKDGIDRVRFYIKPTEPEKYLVGTPYPYHFRAEFSRYPWRINHPLGTEEWVGFSYIFPTKEESFRQSQTPVSIYQNHDGVSGNSPAFQIEIAYPGQLASSSKPYYNTPLGGELMIINQVRGIRWVVPNVRVVAGARLDIIIQVVYGLGNDGLLNIWINGKLQTWPGNATVPAGNVGSTVWPNSRVGGNSKFGLYHHMLRTKEGVDKNYSKGHSHMRMWMTDWNDVFRKPGDWDYKNQNAYSAVNTASYK